MLATAKVQRDHTQARHKAALCTKKQKHQGRTRQKKRAGGRDGGGPSSEQLEAFRKHTQGSVSSRPLSRDNAISETTQRRSTVVAIVKKRVEMLNMNAISREIMQVLADDEDVKLALARKEGQARDTWKEIGTIPNLVRAQAIGSTQAGASPSDASVNGDQNGHNNDETDLPTGTRWMVHAHAPMKVKWDLIVAVLIVYSTLIVPFRIGFERTASALETAMDMVVDVVFAADIAASFRTAFVDENGEVVVDVREIRLRYLKSWFIIDFLSTVPLDFLALYLVGQSDKTVLRSTKMLRILRLARLFKLVRLFKLQSKVGGEMETVNRMNPSVVSLLKMLAYMTYIAHILGCLWHWLVTFEEDGINWVSHFGVEEASVTMRYVASIYWAFTTMTTVGYGDIVVTNTLEMGFCIVGMLIGATVFGYIVGNVSVMMESFDLQSAVRTQKMDRVKEYILSRRFPQKFSRRILDQYKYHYKRISVLDNYTILESLPTTARTSLLFAQYHDAVDNLSFLQNNPPLFVSRLVGCLTACHAKLGDVLFYQNEMGSDLYFIVTGKVNLLVSFNARPPPENAHEAGSIGTCETEEESLYGPYLRQTFTLGKVFKGSKVGEAGLMLDLQQPCAAVSMAVCDLFMVGKEDLLSTLIGYVEVKASLVKEAERFMKRLEEFKKRKGAESESGEETDESSTSARIDGVGRDLLDGADDDVPREWGTDDGNGQRFKYSTNKTCTDGKQDPVRARNEGKTFTTAEVTQPPSLLQPPSEQAVASTASSAMVLPLPGGDASSLRTLPGHQFTDAATKRKPLLCMLEETTEDDFPSGLGGGDSNTCGGGRIDSRNDHGQGAGGLLAAPVLRLKNGGGGGGDDDTGDSSDSDLELVVSQLEERGKLAHRRQSLVTKQIMDLADTAANEVSSGSMAHSNIIQRLSTARNSRKSSMIHPVLPKESFTRYLKGLKRTMSGASDGSSRPQNVSLGGGNGSSKSSSSSIRSSDGSNRDVGNVRDLDVFNAKDGTKTSRRDSRDSDLDRTLADRNGRRSELQEPFTSSRPTITAAGGPPSSLGPESHPRSGEDALVLHPSSAGRQHEGASSSGRNSLVNALHAINLGARLRKVHPVGVNGTGVGGPAALKCNVKFSQASSSSPHQHAPAQNELDGVTSEETEEEEEPNKHLRRKNITSMIFHWAAQRRLQMRKVSMEQLALNDFSPHLTWDWQLLIHPDSIWKAIWDVFMAVLIVFSVLEVTFRLGFQAPAKGSWAVFNYVVDVLFFADMALSFNTAYWNDGNIVTARKSIARNYFRTWFMVDLVSTMPLDALFSTLVQNSNAFRGTKLIRMIRLIRLFKIFRLLKMSTFFERYEDALPMNPSVIRLTKLIVLMSFAAHVAACVWYAVGLHSMDNNRGSWILDYCVSDGVYSSCLNHQPMGSRYMSSLYWAFTTMTTVGYGDIAPANNVAEMITALVSEVAGTTLFAYVIGALVNIVLNLDPQTRLRKQKVEYLSEYMRDFNMTQAQKAEMRRHLNFKLSFNSVFPEMEILATLPPYLRIPAVLYSYRAALPRLPMLCKIEMEYPGFLAVVLPRLRPGEYSKGDSIVSPRLCAQEMGFVLHGMCEGISMGNGQTIEIYREGQCLGDATLLVPDGVSFKLLVEVRALMRVEMLMLHKFDFDWLLTYYPPPIERFRDELTDWEKVLQWISLPKVYTKKIRRIVQRAAVVRDSEESQSFADVDVAATSMDPAATATAAIASSAVPHGMKPHGMAAIDSSARSPQTTRRDSRPPAGCGREGGKGSDREDLVPNMERERLVSPMTRQQRGFGGNGNGDVVAVTSRRGSARDDPGTSDSRDTAVE